ncbi:MAG: HlyC/CorC family transporter [Pseudomonadota bacterium]
MEPTLLFTLGAIVVLLLFSAFFSGSETSLTAVSRPRMHTLEQQGDHRAKLVNQLFARKERLIGAILLGNNLVNIMASALATSVLIGFFGEAGVAYATIAMTLLVLIFAEVLPKTYAIHNADRMALVVAPVMKPVVSLFSPVTRAVEMIVRATLRLFGITTLGGLSDEQSEEELRGVIDLHEGKSEEIQHERQMLRSILDLADVWVEEIMTHRSSVVTINADNPPEKIVEEMLASPYTRFPLWRENSDNIIGVLHAKALLRAVQASGGRLDKLDVTAIATEPWFIPETTDLLSQLQEFRERHKHFAIVVDEYGELLGIVTLEDILEEIVGEIEDEHDVEVEGVTWLADGSCVVDGSVTLRDINRMFEWRLPDDEASTLAGLILYEARRIPEVGQVFVFHGFRFEIIERQRNQITSIKVTPLEESDKIAPPPPAAKQDSESEA